MVATSSSALKEIVFFAARDGMSRILLTVLQGKSEEQIKEYVDQDNIENTRGECLTPLIIASRNGHSVVVRMLIKKFKVDIEHSGSVKYDNCYIDDATPLWVAAGAGHLKVVKLLVKAGANINHTTETNSTPVRAACFDGRLDVVNYLYEHGADVNIPNKFNNTCLMIASYRGYEDVVNYLLETCKVDPNIRAHCGGTALYFACESGRVKIVADLIDHGALFTSNNYGLSPVLAAAERARAEVVEFFVNSDYITRDEKITALELLGASYANDKDRYCLVKAYTYLMRAMEMRFSDPDYTPLVKPHPIYVQAYDNWQECQSIEELEDIEDSPDELHLESLVIRERIIGKHNPELIHAIVYRGAILADHGHFNRCIELWLHAMEISQSLKLSITKDLLRFAQVFAQAVNFNETLSIVYIRTVLKAALSELKNNQENIVGVNMRDIMEYTAYYEEVERNLLSTLYVIKVFCLIKNQCSPEDEYSLCKLIYQIIKLNMTSRNGQTLLHLSVYTTPADRFHTNEICSFPCSTTSLLLIKCGADVNALDLYRNTPLHTIVLYCKPVSDFNNLYNIILNLTGAGAHCDVVNIKGKTPLEMACTGVAEIILSSQTSISLKCLAARAVKKYNTPFLGIVPKCLEEFVELHGRGYSYFDTSRRLPSC